MNAKHLLKVYCHPLPKNQNPPSSLLMFLVFGQRMTVTVKKYNTPTPSSEFVMAFIVDCQVYKL